MSPDGQIISVLTQDDDTVYLDCIEIETSKRYGLWHEDGAALTQESKVAWCTDGRLMAVTYYYPIDQVFTVIVDAVDGTVVARYEAQPSVGSPNGTWLDDHRLLLADWLNMDGLPLSLWIYATAPAAGCPYRPTAMSTWVCVR